MVQRDLYMRQITPLIDNELIKVITGIRRCGKSYMLGLIKEELLIVSEKYGDDRRTEI